MSKNQTEKIIGECLRATADGPFFVDWEFHTLMGLTREQMREIAQAWPHVDQVDRDVRHAVNNAFNNLIGYPHGMERIGTDWISVSVSQVVEIFDEWRKNTLQEIESGN